MKKITTLILTFISLSGSSQSIQTITDKLSDKICDCIKDSIKSYSEIKPEFNRCYDKEFNQIFNLVNADEHKILVQQGSLEKVKNEIIPTLDSRCVKIKRIIQSDLNNSIESTATKSSNPCPTNFAGKYLKDIKNLDGEIIAFNALVTKVYFAHNDKPYYEVKLEGGNTIWIGSLLKSGYEKEGKILRILGYVSQVGNDEYAKKYNRTEYHILAFCVIDMESKQMSMLPGSELQIKEWMNGKIPSKD